MYRDSCIACSTGRIALYFEMLEPIKAFERPSGLARLLIFLYLEEYGTDHGIIAAFDSAGLHPKTGYSALKRAIELGLVISDFDDSWTIRRRTLQLTEKGKRVASHLKEVNDILSERS